MAYLLPIYCILLQICPSACVEDTGGDGSVVSFATKLW